MSFVENYIAIKLYNIENVRVCLLYMIIIGANWLGYISSLQEYDRATTITEWPTCLAKVVEKRSVSGDECRFALRVRYLLADKEYTGWATDRDGLHDSAHLGIAGPIVGETVKIRFDPNSVGRFVLA